MDQPGGETLKIRVIFMSPAPLVEKLPYSMETSLKRSRHSVRHYQIRTNEEQKISQLNDRITKTAWMVHSIPGFAVLTGG